MQNEYYSFWKPLLIILKGLILKRNSCFANQNMQSMMCKQYKNYCLQVFLYLILGLPRNWKENEIYVKALSLCFTSTHPLCKNQSLKLVSKLRTQFPRGSIFGRKRFPLSRNTPFPVWSAESQMGVFLKPSKQPQFLCCYLKFELRSVALGKYLVI